MKQNEDIIETLGCAPCTASPNGDFALKEEAAGGGKRFSAPPGITDIECVILPTREQNPGRKIAALFCLPSAEG